MESISIWTMLVGYPVVSQYQARLVMPVLEDRMDRKRRWRKVEISVETSRFSLYGYLLKFRERPHVTIQSMLISWCRLENADS